jgi:hypothetical protein
MSLEAEELNLVGSCTILIMERQELGCEMMTSCVILSDSETIITPLPGYD